MVMSKTLSPRVLIIYKEVAQEGMSPGRKDPGKELSPEQALSPLPEPGHGL